MAKQITEGATVQIRRTGGTRLVVAIDGAMIVVADAGGKTSRIHQDKLRVLSAN